MSKYACNNMAAILLKGVLKALLCQNEKLLTDGNSFKSLWHLLFVDQIRSLE